MNKLILAVGGACFASAESVQLSAATFYEKVVNKNTGYVHPNVKPWIIKFYAPWCGHCSKLAPEWTKFGAETTNTLQVGKIDCTLDGDKDICTSY